MTTNIDGGSSAILVLTRGRDCGRVVALRSPYLPSPTKSGGGGRRGDYLKLAESLVR